MNRIHMVNHNKTKIPRNYSGFGPWIIIAVIMSIGAIAMITQTFKDNPVKDCEGTRVQLENLMSKEMAAFTALNPGEYEASDMQ